MQSSSDLNPESNPSGESGLTIRLDAFEGPLDLLLHLIRKEEIDIWNIPIARVTEQYLSYLQLMQDLNINLAGEWLVMAATLIYIKSRMLLPPDPVAAQTDETREDPRTELVYQLLEHQKFKNAAQMLHSREEVENAVWGKPPKEVLGDEEEDVIAVTLFDLVRAFREVLQRFESQRAMEMSQEEVTIEQALADFRQILLIHDKIAFSTFFAQARSRQYVIALFLALLELMRLREVWVYQRKAFEEIHISRGKVVDRTP
jgi:segregation and condensation protein A